jgi:oligopeptide/dipeptide ABC transporter ATP-binding protein
MEDLLCIENLSIEYEADGETLRAVDDVSFTIKKGEKFGLVGESGCGKSTIAKSVLRILPKNGRIVNGAIRFGDERTDIVSADSNTLSDLRWEEISIIAQSAMNALDPVYTIEQQIAEAFHKHRDISKEDAEAQIVELFDMVGLDRTRMKSYPHQLSGGMRQRAMIAMALALEPSLVIADEPTTALDVITQDHIMDELDRLSDRLESSMFMITHDISVVAEMCDRIGVMYGGELVEVGPTEELFTEPEHPYTLGLLKAYPTIEGDSEDLITMTGVPPDLTNPPTGCKFYDRCPYREPECQASSPPLSARGPARKAACLVSEEGTNVSAEYDEAVTEGDLWQKL